LLVPELFTERVHVAVPLPLSWHLVVVALTCAELVKLPNRPNTNPAIAMAAMSVMAMRMTVANTGEIALLRL
jgi:hypothetical protein